MYKASVSGFSFEIAKEKDGWLVDGTRLDWNVKDLGNGHYHILHQHKGYRAELVKIDREARTVELKINGERLTVQLRNQFDLLLEKMGMTSSSAGKLNVIKAPMPGLIIDLRVKAGDNVKQGDALLVLEAMKMENIIKAPGEGTVKQVKIKKGDTVEKSQVLIQF
jgi:biotin carboxyl carrier protein